MSFRSFSWFCNGMTIGLNAAHWRGVISLLQLTIVAASFTCMYIGWRRGE